jgi:hypothetical protein
VLINFMWRISFSSTLVEQVTSTRCETALGVGNFCSISTGKNSHCRGAASVQLVFDSLDPAASGDRLGSSCCHIEYTSS